MRDEIVHGDALAVLKTLADNSIDALVTDPPAGVHFMSASWDSDKGGRKQWIAWLQEIMAEALRVVKPGGHALVWALPRTSHWTATALEDAGWEIRDCLTHLFGSGFPKSHDISKAIDKLAGAEREVVSAGQWAHKGRANNLPVVGYSDPNNKRLGASDESFITAPTTPDAQRWQGYGSALKPASEHWILCRKPLAAANLASNVLAWGTGGLNIDATRVEVAEDGPNIRNNPGVGTRPRTVFDSLPLTRGPTLQGKRWPPNFLLSHSPACQQDSCDESCAVRSLDEQAGEHKSGGKTGATYLTADKTRGVYGKFQGAITRTISDDGPVSRFFPVFYASKSSRRERNAGCEGLPAGLAERHGARSQGPLPQQTPQDAKPESNHHPTVKALALMSWLVRLITPPGGIVLDCFAGSGSTLVACVQEGFHYLGIEQDASYVEIARARVAHAVRNAPIARQDAQQTPLPAKIIQLPRRKKHAVSELQLSLFA